MINAGENGMGWQRPLLCPAEMLPVPADLACQSLQTRSCLKGGQAVPSARGQHREHRELVCAAVSFRVPGTRGVWVPRVCGQARVQPLPSAEERGQLTGLSRAGLWDRTATGLGHRQLRQRLILLFLPVSSLTGVIFWPIPDPQLLLPAFFAIPFLVYH